VTICFGAFTLDSDTKQLLRDGRAVHLSPKAFALLAMLLEARPRVLSKADLQQRLWPATFVAEANLSNLVAEVREAIGDRANAPRFVRTAHGFGYAFCGDATSVNRVDNDRGASIVGWVSWGRQRFPLSPGEHIIGRDAGTDIRLNAATVSRRHARVIVASGSLQLEDLGSKNGTFRADQRVTTSIQLADGDVVRIGSHALIIHVRPPGGSTDTAA
jgi:DNA-binding winged helix-turn-helix (wHTH) protein